MENLTQKPILLVDKPKGITSFDVIRILQKISGIKKIGHAGTLDPNATGLLILGIKEGTKELSKLILNDKTYDAVIRLGLETETGDIDGKIIKEIKVEKINEDLVFGACKELIGNKSYIVPNYSAIKINGKKMYELARQGKEIKPLERDMQVYEISNISYKHPFIYFTVLVSKGTYIRSLAKAICDKLNTIGTLYDLRRTTIGQYKIEDAIKLPDEEVQKI